VAVSFSFLRVDFNETGGAAVLCAKAKGEP